MQAYTIFRRARDVTVDCTACTNPRRTNNLRLIPAWQYNNTIACQDYFETTNIVVQRFWLLLSLHSEERPLNIFIGSFE